MTLPKPVMVAGGVLALAAFVVVVLAARDAWIRRGGTDPVTRLSNLAAPPAAV